MEINKKLHFELLKILLNEKQILSIFLVYSFFTSLVYLLIPLGAQLIINLISARVLIQPLIVSSLVVFIGAMLFGTLRILQTYITEILQRKIFAQISADTASRLLFVAQKNFGRVYAPELVNRFFDTMTLQKSLAAILLEIPSAILQIFIGLIVMAIYSPFLLSFDLILIASICIIIFLGKDALKSSLDESNSKYKVAYWLEEIARCNIGFKMSNSIQFSIEELDKKILDYLRDRKKHFSIVLKQCSASYLFEAIASSGVLLIGAWLVINEKMTIGQLVAAEIVVLMIITAINKIVQKIETWYDLLTAIDKVNYISKLDKERSDGLSLEKSPQASSIKIQNLSFSYNENFEIFNNLNLELNPSARASLVGVSGSGKTSLAYILAGLHEIKSGKIYLDNRDINSISLESLRNKVSLVSDFNEIFSGTVAENILLGRTFNKSRIDEVINILELERDLKKYPLGLESSLLSEGRNISLGQRQRILIARAIINQPQLLILDEAFGGMDEMTKLKIINRLLSSENPWTILNITHDAELVSRTKDIFLLEDSHIKEQGLLDDLINNSESRFSQLFPELARLKSQGVQA